MQAQATPPDFNNMDEQALRGSLGQIWQLAQDLATRLNTADAAYQALNTNYTSLQANHTALQSQFSAALVQPHINVTAPVQSIQSTSSSTGHTPKTPKVPKPEPFKGDRGVLARGFIQSCEMYFLIRPDDFIDEPSKIRFALMLLQDRAARWSQPIVQEVLAGSKTDRTKKWKEFREAFETSFFDPDEKRTAAQRLVKLHQTKSTAEYASEFREIIAVLGWTEESQLIHTFYMGLKNHVKDELAKTDDLKTLDELVKSSIKIDNRHWSREKERKEDSPTKPTPRPTPRYDPPKAPAPPSTTPHWSSTAPGPAPMDLSATNSRALTPAEKKRRFDLGLCLYCGGNDHKRSGCQALKKAGGVVRAAMVRAVEEGIEEQPESGKGDSL